jgi:GGDEF domain-containing protein
MQDALTGLENRESFRLRFHQILQRDEGISGAWLGLLELEGLHELNQQQGFAHGDAAGNRLRRACSNRFRRTAGW